LKISLLTFGGTFIGTGHLFRCLAISEWVYILDKSIEISFHLYGMGIESQDKALEILQNRSEYNSYIESDNSIKDLELDVVIVDLLNAPSSIMIFLKECSNLLVSIDNTSESRRYSSIAINPLYYKMERERCNSVKCDYIGPIFQIISPSFFNKTSNWSSEVKNILIIQGGSDPFGVSHRVVQDMQKILLDNKSVVFHIVSGPAIEGSNLLLDLAKKNDKRMVIHHNILKMNDFLKNIDLAISSIGVVAFEIASMGIPAIHVTGVEKELETGLSMDELGVSIFLGMYEKLDPNQLSDTILMLINNGVLRSQMRGECLNNFNTNTTKKLIESILFSKSFKQKEEYESC
jgi:spore coat polysaccharide biosynthesis predicted glycosyltransferase SpsG